MMDFKYVIIGGGTTAGYAAREFVKQGLKKGELCIISAESILPMDRLPLSKGYLSGEVKTKEEIEINNRKFYEENGINIMLETCAKKLDFNGKEIELDSGGFVHYEKLLIATGSTLRHLDMKGNDLENLFYLRNIIQAAKIRNTAGKSRRAVVIGGQYIGTETAASLNKLGLDVTMVFPEPRVLSRFSTDVISGFFEDYYKKKGIKILKNNKVIKLNGKEKVEEVVLSSGEIIRTDMVVAGVGVKPNTALFKGTSLRMNIGVIVNKYCETSIPDVYAAGDITEFPDGVFGGTRHVEHWENALEQGKHAARVMMGKREPYVFVPYFFSDVFDLSYDFFGDGSSADDISYRGNLITGDFSAWWKKDDRLMAAFIMSSRPDQEREKAREWILNRTKIMM